MKRLTAYRLIKAVIWSLSILTVLISAAIFIGRQHPPAAYVAWLHLTDCKLPCWLGIVPGKTTLAEARTRIFKAFPGSVQTNKGNPGYFLINDTRDHFVAQVAINLGEISVEDKTVVDTVYVLTTQLDRALSSQMNLGELQSVIGAPISVFRSNKTSLISIFEYHQFEVSTFRAVCGKLTMSQGIYRLLLSTSGTRLPPEYLRAWQGFDRCYDEELP